MATAGSGFTVTTTIKALPIQPLALIGIIVYVIVTGTPVILVYTSVILAALATVLGFPAGTLVASLDATVYLNVSPEPVIRLSKS